MTHATTADLTAARITVPTGVDAQRLLTVASRDVDQALLCSVYDDTDADVITALRDATVEQVAGMLASGDTTGAGISAAGSFTIGRVSVQRASGSTRAATVNGIYAQAWAVLQQAGLTGGAPLIL